MTPLLYPDDLHWFNEGTNRRLYRKFGAHMTDTGVHFAVWAPNAEKVSVVGEFNGWKSDHHSLDRDFASGVWRGVVSEAQTGMGYKFRIQGRHGERLPDKADPVGFFHETTVAPASRIWDLSYAWHDHLWMQQRNDGVGKPVSIYEMHLGSWCRQGERALGYREMADSLCTYLVDLGYTHVEFMPILEHPFTGSWGYQVTGYFAPTSRWGTPQDLMYLIDRLHQSGIGVILDWVPSHFATDAHGLGLFDGTHLYEHAHPWQGIHPQWQSYVFNYGRHEVVSFLLSSAMFWFDLYHVDGLRVDAVTSMLYRNFGRPAHEWIPNLEGGVEDKEAIAFLSDLNRAIREEYPQSMVFAEESSAWPGVTHPTNQGGLGFTFKWDMGWMHDTLEYFETDPLYRKYRHGLLTFRPLYMEHEQFVLPLSHDEVVHLKKSLIDKMPGWADQKLAQLRMLLAWQIATPGKKLLFMGGEIGQWREWDPDRELDWGVLGDAGHLGIQDWVRQLNHFYTNQPALYDRDNHAGFRWVDWQDANHSILSFLRLGNRKRDVVLVITNFTPVTRYGYRIGVPYHGTWRAVMDSDAKKFNGSGLRDGETVSESIAWQGQPFSIVQTLPGLSIAFYQCGSSDTIEPKAD